MAVISYLFTIVLLTINVQFIKCSAKTIENEGISCGSDAECSGPNLVCINSKCECNTNYKWDSTERKCQYFDCYHDTDCRAYDNNRVCDLKNNTCVCNKGFTIYKGCPDYDSVICQKIQNKINNYCLKDDECQCRGDMNQVCANKLDSFGHCKCRPDFRWFSALQLCVNASFCYDSNYCQNFPNDRICSKDTNHYKSIFCKSCQTLGDCDSNQICFDNYCECEPNYKYDENSKSCLFGYCQYYWDCKEIDINRKCTDSIRICNSCETPFVIDPMTRMCNTTNGMFCSSSGYCDRYFSSQLCINNICQCKPNQKMNNSNGLCESFDCLSNSDCQTYDKHRICEDKICKCDTNYEESSHNYLCEYHLTNSSPKLIWLWSLTLIPAILIILTIIIIRRRRNNSKYVRHSNSSESEESSTQE